MQKVEKNQIISLAVVAGFIIVGFLLLKDSKPPAPTPKVAQVPSESFNQCLDSEKYAMAVTTSTTSGSDAGVGSTPKGFILKNGKVVDTIDGAIPTGDIKAKLDKALGFTLDTGVANPKLVPVSAADFSQGSDSAPVVLIEYADFQCPFCGRFFRDTEMSLINDYVAQGKIKFVYRDFTFLGEESRWAAEAARCAGDQGKFWEYHDYLYNHQSGENQGAFSLDNLKSFAKTLGLQ